MFLKIYYSTLDDNFLKKLPTPPNEYSFNSVIQYYRHFIQSNAFHLTYTMEIYIEIILRSKSVSKVTSIDEPWVAFQEIGQEFFQNL